VNAPATEIETAPEIDVKTLNVYQRINEVRKQVAYLRKVKSVSEGGGYKVVTHDQVTGELREHLITYGIVIEPPSFLSGQTVPTGTTTAKGVPFVRLEATYAIDFVNSDKPEERVSKHVYVHAIDQGDKAPGKAMSYATKAAMLKMFNIETGEDEEERPEVKATGKKDLPGKITATDGTVEQLAPDRREAMNRVLSSIVDCFEAGQEQEAYKAYDEVKDQDERVALWHMLKPHSKMRRRLKDMAEAARLAAGHKPAERDPSLHRRD
jgi:hypothetical protein